MASHLEEGPSHCIWRSTVSWTHALNGSRKNIREMGDSPVIYALPEICSEEGQYKVSRTHHRGHRPVGWDG